MGNSEDLRIKRKSVSRLGDVEDIGRLLLELQLGLPVLPNSCFTYSRRHRIYVPVFKKVSVRIFRFPPTTRINLRFPPIKLQRFINRHPKLEQQPKIKSAIIKYHRLLIDLFEYETEEQLKKAINYDEFRSYFVIENEGIPRLMNQTEIDEKYEFDRSKDTKIGTSTVSFGLAKFYFNNFHLPAPWE